MVLQQLGLQHFLALSAILFSVGLFGVISRRNSIAILLGVELMLNAANINLIAFQRYLAPPAGLNLVLDGQIFALIVITLAACEAAVGLAIILNVYRVLRTTTADEVSLLKW
ncbi:MAG: NADH-quinone oxidoreductase subunit NuoK [Armatimonadetes bacterium]|nr:NADH-quinone oxidoreductase subunit NuoK [Armatimonadota bacterium]